MHDIGRIRIGTSGWSYPSWRRVVYPDGLARDRWLHHYSALFDTVEINASFYGLPSQSTVERWRAAVPDDFVFSVKVGAGLTHRRHLIGAGPSLATHVDRFRILGGSWGPNLLQLPPHWRRDAGRLDAALAAADPHARWAVEVRHRSWLHDEVYEVLRRHAAALVVHDLVEGDHPRLLTADWGYLRLHGPDSPSHPYAGRYPVERLESWGQWSEEVAAQGHDVYVYLDNDVGGAAVADALHLRRCLGGGLIPSDTWLPAVPLESDDDRSQAGPERIARGPRHGRPDDRPRRRQRRIHP